VDLIAALFAVASAYLAYFNYIIARRARAAATNEVMRRLVMKATIAMAAYCVATCSFVISAIASSDALLFYGIAAVAVAGVFTLVFTFVRLRE
jgi:hypothetical protein